MNLHNLRKKMEDCIKTQNKPRKCKAKIFKWYARLSGATLRRQENLSIAFKSFCLMPIFFLVYKKIKCSIDKVKFS